MSNAANYLSESEAPSRAALETLAGMTLIEFGSPYCGHCRAAQPAREAALASFPQWRHLQVEDGPGRALGRSYRVKLWPTFVLLREGQEVARLVRPTQAAEMLDVLSQA